MYNGLTGYLLKTPISGWSLKIKTKVKIQLLVLCVSTSFEYVMKFHTSFYTLRGLKDETKRGDISDMSS